MGFLTATEHQPIRDLLQSIRFRKEEMGGGGGGGRAGGQGLQVSQLWHVQGAGMAMRNS